MKRDDIKEIFGYGGGAAGIDTRIAREAFALGTPIPDYPQADIDLEIASDIKGRAYAPDEMLSVVLGFDATLAELSSRDLAYAKLRGALAFTLTDKPEDQWTPLEKACLHCLRLAMREDIVQAMAKADA